MIRSQSFLKNFNYLMIHLMIISSCSVSDSEPSL